MSREFLYSLNGNKNGALHRWLENFQGEPRIAWYPSAGSDFRDLLYLSKQYAEHNPATKPEPDAPDIFLHTDYGPWSSSTFLDSRSAFVDSFTSVFISDIEELPRCDLPLDRRLVDFPKGSSATGKVIFLEITVDSSVLGRFSVPVIYAFVENSAFCASRLLPEGALLSHVINVRYGGGLGGGGKSGGAWLLKLLTKFQCECFITDGSHSNKFETGIVFKVYPELPGDEATPQLEKIKTIASARWSGHGDVSWNLIKPV